MLTATSFEKLKKIVGEKILNKCLQENLVRGNLSHIVKKFLVKSSIYLKLVKDIEKRGKELPCYIYESKVFLDSISSFKNIVSKYIPNIEFFIL